MCAGGCVVGCKLYTLHRLAIAVEGFALDPFFNPKLSLRQRLVAATHSSHACVKDKCTVEYIYINSVLFFVHLFRLKDRQVTTTRGVARVRKKQTTDERTCGVLYFVNMLEVEL